jgi:hypothetical protein
MRKKGGPEFECLCIVLVIPGRRNRSIVNVHFSLNGTEIEIVNEINYIGVLLNRTACSLRACRKGKKTMHEVLKNRTHS